MTLIVTHIFFGIRELRVATGKSSPYKFHVVICGGHLCTVVYRGDGRAVALLLVVHAVSVLLFLVAVVITHHTFSVVLLGVFMYFGAAVLVAKYAVYIVHTNGATQQIQHTATKKRSKTSYVKRQ